MLPSGFSVGHWTDHAGLTGCTVILCPPDTVGGCDVRGSSPGSRELALLAMDKTMQEVHAVLLTGGSAFGLAAADGVMKFLEERNIGYQTPWVKVPIVPAAVIFDLNIGSSAARPDSSSGYAACLAAVNDNIEEGNVGAGTGATVGKWGGIAGRMKGGLGFASLSTEGLIVSAIAVVNAIGDVLDAKGEVIAGARHTDGRWLVVRNPHRSIGQPPLTPLENTTLVVVMTNARLSKVEVNRLAQRCHDGMARAVKPAHTSRDGDVVFGLACGGKESNLDIVAELAADVTAEAIRRGVQTARSVAGVPAIQ